MGLQQVVQGVGGVIEAYLEDELPAEVGVSVFARDADEESATFGELITIVDDEDATLDEVNTTLAVAAQKGARQIVLTTATGIVANRTYKIGIVDDEVTGGNPNVAQHENVRAKAVNGAVVVLTAPLRYDHAAGKDFRGLRVSYIVDSTEAAHWWADGYAKWSSRSAVPTADPVVEQLDCVLFKIPDRLIDLVDVRQVEPQIDDFIDQNLDLTGALRSARDGFLMDFGPDRCRWSLGASILKRACSLRFCLDRQHAAGQGEQVKAKVEAWQNDYANELNRLRKIVPQDADRDGEPNEPNGDDGYPNMTAL